jgi:drug/metabolite transporter (DMT)-like permease
MQFRIVFTGFFSVLLLRKRITSVQWTALLVIMVGAMVKELPRAVFSSSFSGYGIVGVQICLSVVAGLVNEKILKQLDSPVAVQNVFMYFNSLALHLGYGLSVFGTNFLSEILNVLNNTYLVPVIINAGLIGILTSYFLKHLSSLHKSIASAIELWLTAVLSSLVFGYPIEPSSIAGIIIVTAGVCVYSMYAEPERTGRDRNVKPVTASASSSLFHLKSS